ncbi:MAG: FdrA family protein [Marmoricola sp.]
MTASTGGDHSVEHVEVRPGAYADSVTLLQVSRDVAAVPGVLAAQVAMATPLNLEVLAAMGFTLPECPSSAMVVALRVAEQDTLADALAAVTSALAAAGGTSGEATGIAPPRTIRAALRSAPADAGGLVLVSVPGAHALPEAMDALDAGRDLMVFSDNVPLEQELVLKGVAAERDLLVMGPDCGTAIVGGVGLGFANATERGPVGIVAASGTGCQQVVSLLDAAGTGVGAALGVGGRDLSTDVGGLATRAALARLDDDPSIEHLLVISKPPADEVAEALRTYAASLSTPVTFALLGPGRPDLTAATEDLLEAMGRPTPEWPTWRPREPPGQGPRDPAPGTRASGTFLRGLFVGGTLCDEAMLLAGAALGPIHSNIPLQPDLALDSSLSAPAHLMIDFGDDALTQGRAHPMIDPTLRLEHLGRLAADPQTGVLLIDVVLGHGAEPDPADALAPAIARARADRDLPVVVACVGTRGDPQGLSRQAATLARAGAEVHLSNAAATRRAVELVTGAAR